MGCAGSNDSILHGTFSDQIQAFTAGYFGDTNLFCYIYVLTHNDKIVIVHSVEINNSESKNLLSRIGEISQTGEEAQFRFLGDLFRLIRSFLLFSEVHIGPNE